MWQAQTTKTSDEYQKIIKYTESSGNDSFSFKAMPGVHEKVIELALPYLAGSDIVVLGSGEGSFEHKLLRMGISPQRLTSIDIDPSQYKIEGITCHFCDLNGRFFLSDDSFDIGREHYRFVNDIDQIFVKKVVKN